MGDSGYPYVVKERLPLSLCHVCPLNGQRMVGSDGPPDAEYLGIFEAPGQDEEEYGLTGKYATKYGRPLQGKTGYFMRVRHLGDPKVGLQELLPPYPGRTAPRLGKLKIHLMNVAMCRPPNNKIDSPEGKKAVRCCGNGARWQINEWLKRHPNGTILPAGGTALSLLRGTKTPIEPYRGRFMVHGNDPLHYEDEADIYKYVLRGVKPQEPWWPEVEAGLKHWCKLWRKVERKLLATSLKQIESSFLLENPWLTDWMKLWKKQKAALTRAAKKEAECLDSALEAK